jgi:hypothetical protein
MLLLEIVKANHDSFQAEIPDYVGFLRKFPVQDTELPWTQDTMYQNQEMNQPDVEIFRKAMQWSGTINCRIEISQ